MRHDTAMKKSHNVKSKLYFVGFVIYDSIMGILAFTNYTFLFSFVFLRIFIRQAKRLLIFSSLPCMGSHFLILLLSFLPLNDLQEFLQLLPFSK